MEVTSRSASVRAWWTHRPKGNGGVDGEEVGHSRRWADNTQKWADVALRDP